jgi:hypothetical protein
LCLVPGSWAKQEIEKRLPRAAKLLIKNRGREYRIGAHSSIGMVPAPIASKYNLLDSNRRMSLKGTISQKKVL